jgi:hypothetical protein
MANLCPVQAMLLPTLRRCRACRRGCCRQHVSRGSGATPGTSHTNLTWIEMPGPVCRIGWGLGALDAPSSSRRCRRRVLHIPIVLAEGGVRAVAWNCVGSLWAQGGASLRSANRPSQKMQHRIASSTASVPQPPRARPRVRRAVEASSSRINGSIGGWIWLEGWGACAAKKGHVYRNFSVVRENLRYDSIHLTKLPGNCSC